MNLRLISAAVPAAMVAFATAAWAQSTGGGASASSGAAASGSTGAAAAMVSGGTVTMIGSVASVLGLEEGAVDWLGITMIGGLGDRIVIAAIGAIARSAGCSSRASQSTATSRKTIPAVATTGTYRAGLRRICAHFGTIAKRCCRAIGFA